MRKKSICELCGRIGHKADAYIICGPKCLIQSIRINMNKFNTLNGEEPNEPPMERNNQPPETHFKYRTSTPNTRTEVSAITGRLNHNAIYNGDFEVHPSDFPVELNSESFPYPDTTPIKSIDDEKMDHILEFFHSEHDEYLLDVDLQMLQD